jgi:myosin heavy subunit
MGLLKSIGKGVKDAISGDKLSNAVASAIGGIPGMLAKTGVDMLASQYTHAQDMKAYGSRYQMMVKDMERAGLNPGLSQNLNPGSIPAMSTPLGSSTGAKDLSEVGRNEAQAVKTYQEVKQITAEMEKWASEISLNKVKMRTIPQEARAKLMSAKSNIINAVTEIDRVAGQVSLWQHQEKLFGAQTNTARAQEKLLHAQANTAKAHASLMGAQEAKAKQETENLAQQLIILYDNMAYVENMEAVDKSWVGKGMAYVDRVLSSIPVLGLLTGGFIGRNTGKRPSTRPPKGITGNQR